MQRILFLFFLMAFTYSCKKHGDVNAVLPLKNNTAGDKILKIGEIVPQMNAIDSSVVSINIPGKATEIKINELVEDYRYIHLETTDECLIGEITKLVIDSSLLFIFDKENSNAFCFSKSGKYLTRYGKKGRGPQEFSDLYDMAINTKQKEVCLLDLGGGKLIYYDYSGSFLREQSLYYYFYNLEFLENMQVQSTGFAHNAGIPQIASHRLLLSKDDQEPKLKGFAYPGRLGDQFHWVDGRPLFKKGEEIYFHHILSDTIWQVQTKGCIARYVLKFSGRNNLFSEGELSSLTDEKYREKTSRQPYFFGNYLLSDQYLYLGICEQRAIYPLLYSRSSSKIFYGSFNTLGNKDVLGISLLSGTFDFVYSAKSFIKVVQPFSIMRIMKSMKEEEKKRLSSRDLQLLQNIKDEDNPILMVVDLKDF